MARKQGRFGRKYKQQPLLCAATLHQKDEWSLVVGTSSGDIYVFADRECSNAVSQAHSAAVLCLCEVRTDSSGDIDEADVAYLVSGGKDMFIKVWNQALQPISALNLSSGSVAGGIIKSVDASVGSVDYRFIADDLVVLAGLYGGEIFEVTAVKADSGGRGGQSSIGAEGRPKNTNIATSRPALLLHSHFSGELWGLATHPLDADVFATAGDDSTVKIWSISKNLLLGSVNVGWPARALAWHPSGTVLAVGYHEWEKGGGGGKKTTKTKSKASGAAGESDHNGAVRLYSYARTGDNAELTKLADGCESKATVADIKFSPLGNVLAVGTHDRKLYKYDLSDHRDSDYFRSVKIFTKHSSAVLHFDFSVDEKWMQSTCQAYELLFSEAKTAVQETSASKLAHYNSQRTDENAQQQWITWTCPLGWPVQGIWPSGADGSDINSVDRSHAGNIIATADDFGLVKLFRYPCVKENSKFVECTGHSSHVTNVRWTLEDVLISVGGNDKCVFVWRIAGH